MCLVAGVSATMSYPSSIAMDALGAVAFVNDEYNCLLRRIIVASASVFTIAGSAGACTHADGQGGAALFNNANGLTATSSGAVALVVDSYSGRVRLVISASASQTRSRTQSTSPSGM